MHKFIWILRAAMHMRKLMGWWNSDRDMIRQLNRKGFRVVSWTKR